MTDEPVKTRKRKEWRQYRNSITGKYCSEEYAMAHPDTTQSISREQEVPVQSPGAGGSQ